MILSGNEKEYYHLNFKKRILNMKKLLNSWKCRNLSLKGKITIVNTFALSSLLYLASVIHVASIVFKEVKHIVADFIWEGKTSKIAYDVLIQQTEEEGLKLVDFEDKVMSLKVMWVKCLTKGEKERLMATPTVFYKHKIYLNISCLIKTKLKWNQNVMKIYIITCLNWRVLK